MFLLPKVWKSEVWLVESTVMSAFLALFTTSNLAAFWELQTVVLLNMLEMEIVTLSRWERVRVRRVDCGMVSEGW